MFQIFWATRIPSPTQFWYAFVITLAIHQQHIKAWPYHCFINFSVCLMLKPLKTIFLQYFLLCQHQTMLQYDPQTIFFTDHDLQGIQKWQHSNHIGNVAAAFARSWSTNVIVISQHGDLQFNFLMTAAWLHTKPPIHTSPVTCAHLYRKLLTCYSLAHLHNKRSLLYVCVKAYEIQ